jgi:multiphosphoryl transfer protein
MSDVVLQAPVRGWLTPLEEVPDPVFAERMMGDGLAIDPLEKIIRAPADATVISIPDTAHAVTLRLSNGAELLIHIGLETVALGGKGFRALCGAGAVVRAGDPLIEFDLAAVATAAKSLVTPLIVANEGFELTPDRLSRQVVSGEPIATVRGVAGASALAAQGEAYERSVRVDAAHGLHARPAARIAALVKSFPADVSVARADRTANAKSVVALMGLGVRRADELRIIGRGSQGQAAVDAVVALIEAGLGEEQSAAPLPVHAGRGGAVCASPGLAVGTIVQFRAADLPVDQDGKGVTRERELLANALKSVRASLSADSPVEAGLAEAHLELLEDPELNAAAAARIAEGRSAGFAWRAACEAARETLRATGDPLLMERAADLLDIERRVIALLTDGAGAASVELPAEALVVAPDLLPSEFLALDRSRLAGICTAEGGPTSHVAILAASSGIPMLAAAGPSVLQMPEGTVAVLDAERCNLEAQPSPERLQEARAEVEARRSRRSAEVERAQELCFTADGARIEVFANLASAAEATSAVSAGAEGCGLLRTEFLFLGRDSAPDEEEQRAVYAQIAAALDGRPLIVRTIDIGADKQVSYLGVPREDNPALGLRGVRLSLARPELLQTQLRAVLRAAPTDQLRIMLPMIADVSELRESRAALEEAQRSVSETGRVSLGVMIETPASAMLARELAAEADFLSVGTNDLTQYALAADRTNAGVSAMIDAFHPAVLRLIGLAGEGAAAHGRCLAVCGGLASDPLAAALLIGLGVTELSVAPAAIPAVKAVVRGLRMDQCREVAKRACAAATAAQARAIAAEALS